MPQAEAVSPVVHWLPRQQPFGQLEGPQLVTCISQIPLVQVKLAGHVWQVPPAPPQMNARLLVAKAIAVSPD